MSINQRELGRSTESPAGFLAGSDIVLRPLRLTDIDGPYLTWLNDEEVCEFNSHHIYPYSREEAEEYISSTRSDKSRIVLAIELRKTCEHIGNVALQSIHPVFKSAEFSILLGDKRYWGQGYGKESGFLLCRHGFRSLNLNRIFCGTHENNYGMQKLAAYLGMKEEGRSRQAIFKNGEFHDTIHYGVLANEFAEQFKH